MKKYLIGCFIVLFFMAATFYSATNFDRLVLGSANYGTDPNPTADITFQNDEYISNATDGVMKITGQIQTDAGSQSSPTYSFSTSTGSGMYLNASNILAFTTAGTDRVFVDAGGRFNVGAEQTSAMFGVKNITSQVNIALFTNVDGTTRATLDSAGTFTPIKYGAAILAGSVTASDSSTSVILKDSGGKKWKIKVNTQGVVSADSTGLN